MSQPSDRYVHEVSSGVLSSHQAEALLELKTLLENLEQLLESLRVVQEKEKRHPTTLRAIEGQVAPLLDHFKTSLFMYLRSRPNDLTLEDLTIMQR